MFSPGRPPQAAARAKLRALRLSLNTPVLDIEGLPVGPARAGIALHETPTGGTALCVVLRSVRSDAVLYYAGDAALALRFDASRALDVALAFAEGLGFLFDDDLLGSPAAESSEAAARLWCDLLEPPEAVATTRATAGVRRRAGVPLTKFRRAAARTRAPGPPPGASNGPLGHA